MPGSIQVSVIECADFAPPPSSTPQDSTATSLSLKVAVGKKEYSSAGEGDFSFPVLSLRENLVVMLQNAEGKMLSQTEVKIMSVVEKGKWDVIFSLEGGGSVLLRLHFSLNEEERKRISEVRNSALKRKREELLKGGNDSSIPGIGQKSGDSGHHVVKELDTVVEHGNSSGNSLSQEVREYSKHPIVKADDNSTGANEVDKQQPLSNAKERHVSFGECSNPHVERPGFLKLETSVGGSFELEKDIPRSTKRKNFAERSSSTNIRKMINAFENSLPQGPGPQNDQRIKTQMTRIQSAGSLRTMSSDSGDIKGLPFPQTMTRSSSVEMLSELNLQKSPRFGESPSLKKNLVLDSNDSRNVKSIQDSGKEKAIEVMDSACSILEFHHPADLHNSKSGVISLTPIDSVESVNLDYSVEHASERKYIVPFEVRKSTPIKSVFKSFDASEETRLGTETGYSLARDTGPVSSVEIPSASNGKHFSSRSKVTETEEMHRLGGAIKCLGGENLIAIAGNKSPRTMHMDELDASKKKNPLPKEYCTLDTNSDYKSSSGENLGKCSLDDDNGTLEKIVSGPIRNFHKANLKAMKNNEGQTEKKGFQKEALPSQKVIYEATRADNVQSHKHIDLTNGSYCFEMFGIWMPHHLCLTTGSKQLRDLYECGDICAYTPIMEENMLVAVSYEKNKMQGDACGMNRNDKISGRPGDMKFTTGTTMMHGWLVAQGARIIIMIVACGTIFLNTR